MYELLGGVLPKREGVSHVYTFWKNSFCQTKNLNISCFLILNCLPRTNLRINFLPCVGLKSRTGLSFSKFGKAIIQNSAGAVAPRAIIFRRMTAADLAPSEYGSFYTHYVSLVPAELDLGTALRKSAGRITDYLSQVPESQVHRAYAPGKWTLAQSLQHLIDTDRIFTYRALCLARGESTPLPGFDQDDYAALAIATDRHLPDMIQEFTFVRASVVHMFAAFGPEALVRSGTVSGNPMSCRAMGFIAAGHTYHHDKIFRERYS